ncbi:tumor necrosis factor receptor superfamily member 10C-like [Biomphalaria glabrata]|uniref:Tumor necrosis factor receptor superfamily member 10C-like n=1 Tax=Biomphalaria glabrata TaxID=6526 RepID=A0A9W2YNW0_BIOGL|nr:tumor necrosis factor receptor superfamily member 10C-like [Biomphalaria glabrata]XP_013069982.2 tumor necrosis factor receptor superfamily member 10C-like [Biomphalaria glabrata]XP_055864391.1 tumor necrosis factor receptor superfamily member 10C-like [Biomphalaria glabrata]XP_055864392.1 tumor necrosis factor receptor superfamily member 10C-like [Biomphalaria glabrata]XP_055864393.1 tumor necrosis factor receptor superfamily member 10C-like [Biomphalaria glabrata]XP_055864394.1 tumor necr
MATLQNRHVFIFIPTILIALLPVSLALCRSGQYLSTNECVKCSEGSYMDADNHTNEACKECEDADDTKVFLQECNATHNSELKCKEERFSKNGRPLVCQICSQCSGINKYEAANCTKTSDTVCCPEPAMKLEPVNENTTCLNISSDTNLCCLLITTTTSIASSPKSQSKESTTEKITGSNGTMDSSSTDNVENSSSMEPGAIAGIVIGFLVFAGIVVAVFYFRRQIRSLCDSNSPSSPQPTIQEVPLMTPHTSS